MSVEILAPAGNEKCFFSAIKAGANAIYIGLNEFSARKSAENFCVENLGYYLNYAHFFGVKVYVAVNTLIKDCELDDFLSVVSKAYSLGADAFIMQDMFLGRELKKIIPNACLHLSTQAGVCNVYGAKLAKEFGFSRVILARETALEDIRQIAKIIETEVFVQGALCSSFSGHCYMSSFAGGLSGNRGYCKQPCRKKYTYSGEGFTSFKGYNLSLSDLCLKDKIKVLEEIGVSSFKIEGRMRSPEYVYSSVRVYLESLIGKPSEESVKYLRRSFNRGDYTEGYFTGVTTDIISNKIQGNIGDFIGCIKSVNKNEIKVDTTEIFTKDDGFKITRNGLEVGSALYIKAERDGCLFAIKGNVKVGDKVYITKDNLFASKIENIPLKKDIQINITIKENDYAKAEIKEENNSIIIYSDQEFPVANNRGVDESEVESCFNKVDEYPFIPEINVCIIGSVFCAKSVLNAFRRKCYQQFFSSYTSVKNDIIPSTFAQKTNIISNVKNNKKAYIITEFNKSLFDSNSLYIYRPKDYFDRTRAKAFLDTFNSSHTYLYVPPYASGKDLEIIKKLAQPFYGIYTEGYYGIELAREMNKRLFLGTGINIFNSVDVSIANELGAEFAYSKELGVEELSQIYGNGFALSCGAIQVMDLIYCPFSMKCKECNRGDIYSLTDEEGRAYVVRRYKISGCRFEVYNPFDLISTSGNKNALFDFTLYNHQKSKNIMNLSCNIDELKKIIPNYTRGQTKGIK